MERTRSVSWHLANSANDRQEQSTIFIDALPTELMIQIFEYLSHKERLRIEAVCKKWKECSQATWRSVKTLKISYKSKPDLMTTNNSYVKMKIQDGIVTKILSLCGETVNHLLLKDRWDCFPDNTYVVLSKFFRNLRKVEIMGSENNVVSLRSLFEENIQLESVSMELMEQHQKLMKYLPDKLTELSIPVHGECDIDEYVEVIKNLPTLRCLDTPVDDYVLEAIGTLDKLTSLDIANCDTNFSVRDLLNITKLCNLEYLSMQKFGRFITDEFLVELARKCRKIVQLHIDCRKCLPRDIGSVYIPPRPRDVDHRRGTITQLGLNALSMLPELKELDICYEEAMCDEVLFKFTNLRKLRIDGCEKLTDSGILLYIESNKNLEELEVKSFETGRIEKILSATAEVIEERTDRQSKVLTVVLDDSYKDIASAFDAKSEFPKVKAG